MPSGIGASAFPVAGSMPINELPDGELRITHTRPKPVTSRPCRVDLPTLHVATTRCVAGSMRTRSSVESAPFGEHDHTEPKPTPSPWHRSVAALTRHAIRLV